MNYEAESDFTDFIPYSSHVAQHVVKTREGDYMVSWHLAGVPFVGRDPAELAHRHATFSRLLQVLRAPDYLNVSFWVHDVRRRRGVNMQASYAARFNQQLHDWYFSRMNDSDMLVNELYLTFIYRPVVGVSSAFSIQSADPKFIRKQQDAEIAKILELADNVSTVLSEYAPYRLGTYEASNGVIFSEVLEFLGYILNRAEEPVPVSKTRIFNYLATSKLVFNESVGNYLTQTANGVNHVGTMLTFKEFPETTHPGVLNGLKYLGFEYVLTHSFAPVGKRDALVGLQRTKARLISSGDKSLTQIADLDQAMDGISSGAYIFGDYHFTMSIYGASIEELDRNVSEARSVLAGAGFVSAREDLAGLAAFFAQLPCNWKYRTRKSMVSSRNFLGLAPLHNFSIGKKQHNPWGDAVTVLSTTNQQPFFFNFHATRANENSFGEKALANTMVIGKSGTGKTALINFLLSQVQKFEPRPTIFFFDKDRGAEIFVRACGGKYMAIGAGAPTGFNPLQCESNASNVMFLVGLVKLLAAKQEYSASEDEDVLRAVKAILDTPLHLRTMLNLQSSLPNLGGDCIYARLKKWTRNGHMGWVFDNPKDQISFDGSTMIGFDYTELIDHDEARIPVVMYLIHRMEQLIDGRRFIFVMDEFWKILDGEGGLKEFARNKLKTIRKQNGFGIFATQSPEDALKSDISAALVEQTATLILLPNPSADRDDYVNGLKLTETEYETVKALDERSRCFLVKQGHDTAVCHLQLNGTPNSLAVISASTDNIAVLHRLLNLKSKTEGAVTVSLEEGSAEPLMDFIDPETWLSDFYEQQTAATSRKQVLTGAGNEAKNVI
jgi:type IV secretion system protein VirB4